MSRKMNALGHRGDDHRFDPLPLEHDLPLAESQHRVSEQDQPGVGIQVATASRGRAVILEAVDLNDEPVADQKVDGVPIDPHLLTNPDTEVADSSEEVRLEARVDQR